jgi:hypothetical protein
MFASAQPVNDLCQNAAVIEWSTLPLTTSPVSIANASPAAEAENPCVRSGYTVWYTFVASADATVIIDTCAANNPSITLPDTTLSLYEAIDGTCATLAAVWCNDDSCSFRSSMTYAARSGVRYFVQVGQFRADDTSPPPVTPDDVISISMRLAPPPAADHWVEAPEAGTLPGDAQQARPSGALTMIDGWFDFEGDVDMYALDVCTSGPISISTVGLTSVDTQLFLFAESGVGIAANDDDPRSLSTQSFISFPNGLDAGRYFLAISTYNQDPINFEGELLWNDSPFRSQRGPDGPAATSVVAGWSPVGGLSGPYSIALTGFSPATACTPDCPICPADYNNDGGIDGSDLGAFFVDWEISQPCADVNLDGGVDGGDIEAFIVAWEAGSC